MLRPRIYISGPIAFVTDRNRTAFDTAAAALQDLGWDTVNPLDLPAPNHDGPCRQGTGLAPGSDHAHGCYITRDLHVLLACDALFLLPGWDMSVGAKAEQHAAEVCGLRIVFAQLDGTPGRFDATTKGMPEPWADRDYSFDIHTGVQ